MSKIDPELTTSYSLISLPWPKPPWPLACITVRRLLTHLSVPVISYRLAPQPEHIRHLPLQSTWCSFTIAVLFLLEPSFSHIYAWLFPPLLQVLLRCLLLSEVLKFPLNISTFHLHVRLPINNSSLTYLLFIYPSIIYF